MSDPERLKNVAAAVKRLKERHKGETKRCEWCLDLYQGACDCPATKRIAELEAALKEIRTRLHANGRRPEECCELRMIDAVLLSAQKAREVAG